MPIPFPASYNGLCIACGEDIKRGEMIVISDVGYVHEECREDVGKAPEATTERRSSDPDHTATIPRGKTAKDRCGSCFIIHTPGQEGCE
jgi:hypothetical protein